jgi:large subunit ribosomal protein L23
MKTRPRPRKYVQKLERRQPAKHGEPGFELRPYQVVLRPLVTEKGTHQSTRYNSYTFMVNPLASKVQIKGAIEDLFKVRVEKVRTQTRRPKEVVFRGKAGISPGWKKAIVTLNIEDKIDFF